MGRISRATLQTGKFLHCKFNGVFEADIWRRFQWELWEFFANGVTGNLVDIKRR